MSKKHRLDQYLVEQGHYETRSRARDAILRGAIRIDGVPATKPAMSVPAGAGVEITDPASTYVSRAALKLKAGLQTCKFSPAGLTCLDLGASTGGFCQVLLEAGARRVIAIDIGHDQMHPTIAGDPRVENLEGINARELTREQIGGARFEFLTCDMSFISLRLALPPALALAEPGAQGIFLIKPQFELGREALGKGGIVRDGHAGELVAREIAQWLEKEQGWRVVHQLASPLRGGDGNLEYLLCARKNQ